MSAAARRAALPLLDHLKLADYRHVYEPCEDSYLLADALAGELDALVAARPTLCVEIG
jgi:release factor glutamine methyltransferase